MSGSSACNFQMKETRNGPLKSFMSSGGKKRKIPHQKANFHSWSSHTNWTRIILHPGLYSTFLAPPLWSILSESKAEALVCLCHPSTQNKRGPHGGHVWSGPLRAGYPVCRACLGLALILTHTHTGVFTATTALHGCVSSGLFTVSRSDWVETYVE